jgi:hypothetical protein
VTTSNPDYTVHPAPVRPVSLDELFRGVRPIESVEDLVCEGIFDTDEELDEFLRYTYADRRANLA